MWNAVKAALRGKFTALNSYIRKEFEKMGERLNIKVYEPEPILCTDNAAMIAANGYYKYIKNEFADMKLNAVPNLKLD